MVACPNLHRLSLQFWDPLTTCLPWHIVIHRLEVLEYDAMVHKGSEAPFVRTVFPVQAPKLKELVVSRVSEVSEWYEESGLSPRDDSTPRLSTSASKIIALRAPNLTLFAYVGLDPEKASGVRPRMIASLIPRGVTGDSLNGIATLKNLEHLHFAPGALSNFAIGEFSSLLRSFAPRLRSLTVTLRSAHGCDLDSLLPSIISIPNLVYLRIAPGSPLDYLGDRSVDATAVLEIPARCMRLRKVVVAKGLDFLRRGIAETMWLGRGGGLDAVKTEWLQRWGKVCELEVET
ncbi:hypothetical protein HDU93_004537 [Gonapodya sp. JEL0774]|nr:hypothetical protein HDU93_004537 [Gonapodya sp. JEL0774]